MTSLVLCRHGESAGNVERRFGGHGATPLTERGREQARALGRALSRTGVDAIYSSDLARARQTAELVGAATGIEPELAPALRERSVGALTDLTFEEAEERFPEAFRALMNREKGARPPGGETYRECQLRAVALLDRVLAERPGERIVFVSHRITISRLTCYLLGSPDDPDPDSPSPIDNAGLHRFSCMVGKGWVAQALNERAHLSEVDPGVR
jgi:broad specificity phosphatase PhoE